MMDLHNRAFMYGESVFTTVKMVNGVLLDWEYHFDRLKRGTEFVYGPFTDGDGWMALLKNRLETACQSEKGDKVIRLALYREQARGLRKTGLISVGDLKINLAASPLDFLRSDGRSVSLKSCEAMMKPKWWPSYLKAGSYLDVILAQKVCLGPEDDDLLFLSPEGLVLESSVANIFFIKHDRMFTPSAGTNVLEGVMRKKVLEAAPKIFTEVTECPTTLDQALKADLVFATNSIRGLFLVERIDGKEISGGDEALRRFELLREKVGA